MDAAAASARPAEAARVEGPRLTVHIFEGGYDKHSHMCSKHIQPAEYSTYSTRRAERAFSVIATTTPASVAAAASAEEEEEAQPADLSRRAPTLPSSADGCTRGRL